jgi:propanol-preferring alcohol dehydrogenase
LRAVQLTDPPAPLKEVGVPDPDPGPDDVLIRITAAGICHSDAHYRAGDPKTRKLPITLGHEIAGVVEAVGTAVDADRIGERVAVHYVVSDGTCARCRDFGEQFCEQYEMFGLTLDGGYAEAIAVPARNAVQIPEGIPDAQAAVMMCSSVTSLHALRKSRLVAGESVAVFGVGGLGMSAVQIASNLGASRVFAVDIDQGRLDMAAGFGATSIPVDADPAEAIRDHGGADVALLLVDRSPVFAKAQESLKPGGRLVAVGIARDPVPVVPYKHLILGEHELIGSNDHLRGEIDELFAMATSGTLRLDDVVSESIPLDAAAINTALDRLDTFGPGVRSVIAPG